MNTVKIIRKYLGNKIYNINTGYMLALLIRGLLNIWQTLKIIPLVLFSTERRPLAKTSFVIPKSCSIAYINMPKGGCSSIRKALMQCDLAANKSEIILDNQGIHIITKGIEYFDTHKIKLDTFVFTFVRNPFERLVSLYLNKFRNIGTLENGGFIYSYYLGGILTIDMTFEEFVKTIVRIPDRISERHFKSQYSVIYSNDVDVDYIGKFEELSDDFESIRNRFPTLGELPYFNRADNYDYRKYYTLELVELVANRYRKDIDKFGYMDNELELLDFTRLMQGKTYVG